MIGTRRVAALAGALFMALVGPAWAQEQDPQELKRRILQKVREKLTAERAAFLERMSRIIDEELAKEGPKPKAPAPAPKEPAAPLPPDVAKKVQEEERLLRIEEEKIEKRRAEVERLKREASDEDVKKEAKRDGPHDAQEARELFDAALAQHEQKSFKQSIRMFKRIYYQFPKSRIGFISAYNVACGHALAGEKELALDWLETSVRQGYDDFDHLREDTDLDNLRDEKRYKKLLTDR